jgi:FKBP-type peptidyl-prolyl cis-trans isomerase SlyD
MESGSVDGEPNWMNPMSVQDNRVTGHPTMIPIANAGAYGLGSPTKEAMMTADAKVGPKKIVRFSYTLHDDEGALLDEATVEDPAVYLHGAENIIDGLETALLGHTPGDTFKTTIKPDDAYGEPHEVEPGPLPRDLFPEDTDIYQGMMLTAEDDEGEPVLAFVSHFDETNVWVTTNHPLAGKTLHYAIEVLDVRDATSEELAEGQPADLDLI